ncbi:type II toxin-antitoxin system ParD family antitoxin [Azospirillum melinis]
MNVSLTPELERFVVGRVATGRCGSASEVVRAALRLLERDECVVPRGPAPLGRGSAV